MNDVTRGFCADAMRCYEDGLGYGKRKVYNCLWLYKKMMVIHGVYVVKAMCKGLNVVYIV